MVNGVAVVASGLVAALVFSVFTGMARAMGMTKMSIEKMLGAMLGEGPMADMAGWVMHLASGVAFAGIYAQIFNALGATNGWAAGAAIGLIHGLMIGAIVLPMMGAVHPAVSAGRIEAPGFFGINSGSMTPMGMIVGHIIFGAVLGGVYFTLA